MGPGKTLVKIEADMLRAVLYNFDKNDAGLKVEHQKLLREAVGPVVRDGGFIMLMGLASTTGNVAYDYRLGLARELSVRNFLVSKFGHKFKFTKELSFGKIMALAFADAHLAGGTADNDLIASSIGGIVGMPAVWTAGDAYANVNGQIQGGADAIQDMTDQFSDPKLDTTPLSKWPAVTVPVIHTPNNAMPSAFEQAWRSGQATGRNNAVKAVINLEQNPKPIELKNGDHIRLNGRSWLRSLSIAFKDDAGIEIVLKPANEELRKKGRPPFPTHP